MNHLEDWFRPAFPTGDAEIVYEWLGWIVSVDGRDISNTATSWVG
jgi:hypothetical protein